MAKLIDRISEMARGPKGRELAQRAREYARDPETKRKITEARGRLARRRDRGA